MSPKILMTNTWKYVFAICILLSTINIMAQKDETVKHELFGQEWTKEDLRTRVGDMSQIAGIRRYELASGIEKGVEAVDFWTGSGFRFTVLPDRGIDISAASYRGSSLSWWSSQGEVSPTYYEPLGMGWARSFYGGLMVTCGMTFAGIPNEEEARENGLHGRFSNTPAENFNAWTEWRDDGYYLVAKGKVRESNVFGPNLVCTRTITAKMGDSHVSVHDVVENVGFRTQPFMYLYHINIGFPVVDDGARFICPSENWEPRDEEAADGKESATQFHSPVEGYSEKVYYYDMEADKNGLVHTAIVNDAFNTGEGLGVYLVYRKAQLPYYIGWKMMGQGEYVVGMEPANCHVEGRENDLKEGRLQYLEPGEKKEFNIEIGVLGGKGSIAEFEKMLGNQ